MVQRSNSIVIIGIGNPLLRDDTAGLLTIDVLEKRIGGRHDVTLKKLYCGGFDLIAEIDTFTSVVLIDCILDPGLALGEVKRFRFAHDRSEDGRGRFVASSHGIDLNDVLATGTLLGLSMPHEIIAYGICGKDVSTFDTTPQLPVITATEALAETIERDINSLLDKQRSSQPQPEVSYYEG